MNFRDILEDAVTFCGNATALSYELNVSIQEVSRMRQKGGKVLPEHMDKLLELTNLMIVKKDERDRLIDAASLFAELCKTKKDTK